MRSIRAGYAGFGAGLLALAGLATVLQAQPAAVPVAPGMAPRIALPGAPPQLPRGRPYLAETALPDGIGMLPPPPAKGSPEEARDKEMAAKAHGLRGTARWDLARRDADLFTPGAIGAFSCAAGRDLSADATPLTNRLLGRVALDLAGSTTPAKNRYMRPRPFMIDRQPLCTPESEDGLRHNGSYPSGHAAIGYGWGLVLAALVPGRRAELTARGKAFGDSRRICNVHWDSDVVAGQALAAATFVTLRKDAAFRADFAAAKAELGKPGGVPAASACTAERSALELAR